MSGEGTAMGVQTVRNERSPWKERATSAKEQA